MAKRKTDLRILGLGDDKLLARLQDAAKAAGVDTVEQLADLVVDSGISARPPVDPYTERFTLEELGQRLWAVATTYPQPARRAWYEGLTPAQQASVVTVLRSRQYTAFAISNDFGLTEVQVEKIYAEHVTKLGEHVLGVRLDTMVGQITQAKQRAQQMAMEKGDAAAIWRIEKEFTSVLQDLGVVERAARKVELVDKAEEAKAAALQRMVALAEKQAARRAEIARAERERTEPQALPEAVEAEYEVLKNE